MAYILVNKINISMLLYRRTDDGLVGFNFKRLVFGGMVMLMTDYE